MSGHTPGPWMIEPYSDEDETLYVCANYMPTDDGFARATWIAECDLQDGNLAENAANARLIAAAPDLLAALKETLNYWKSTGFADCEPECDCIVESVRAALAKADGAA
jgi:hypothetical protein